MACHADTGGGIEARFPYLLAVLVELTGNRLVLAADHVELIAIFSLVMLPYRPVEIVDIGTVGDELTVLINLV